VKSYSRNLTELVSLFPVSGSFLVSLYPVSGSFSQII